MSFFNYMAARAADSHAARTGNAGYSTMKEKAVSGDVRGAQKMAADLAIATGMGTAFGSAGALLPILFSTPGTIAGLEAENALLTGLSGALAVGTAVAPYALVNPIVAAKKIGGKINYQKIFK